MKKIINIRILFICLIALITGILFSFSVFIYKLTAGNIVALSFLCVAAAALLAAAVFTFFKAGGKIKQHRVHFINALVFLLLGIMVSFLWLSSFSSLPSFNGESSVTGRVSGNVVVYENRLSVTLQDVTAVNGTVSEKLNSNVRLTVFVYGFNFALSSGDIITFPAELAKKELTLDSRDLSYYINNTVYSASVSANEISAVKSQGKYLDEAARDAVKTMLHNNMNAENADLAYSVLFGGREYLTQDVVNAFTASGLAHLLAVSGLNVTFLVALLTFVLKKLKCNKYINISVITFVLLLYCFLCGFSPSIVRASIMGFVLLASYLLGQRYDAISSLSLAALIILLVSPVNLFSIGFQLSFISVFGIFTLYPITTKAFIKIKLPKAVASSVAISVASVISITPITMQNFQTVSIISVFSNLLAVPLFSAAFILLFSFVVITLVLPFMGFILFLPDVLIHVTKLIANFFAGLSFSVVTAPAAGWWLFVGVAAIMFFIKYVMVKKKTKAIISAAFIVSLLLAYAITLLAG